MGHPAVSYTEQLGRRYKVAKDGHTKLVVRSTMNADNGYTYADRLSPVNTSELDIFRLCALLGVEMSPEQAATERAYIEKNRQLYEQKSHETMEKREFGLDANGYPVYPGETMYRKSNADKYTVQEDGSLKKDNGKTVTAPDWSHFVHTYDKTDKAGQLTAARAKRFAPKQDNPLVEGGFKIRTPEEASKAAAKQREQERKKESADPAASNSSEKLTDFERELISTLDLASNEELAKEIHRRGILLVGETIHDATDDQLEAECARRGISTAPDLRAATNEELLAEVNKRPGLPCKLWEYILRNSTDEMLLAEIDRRGLNKTAAALAPTLDAATDAEILGEVTHREDLFQRIQITALNTASDDEILTQYNERGLLSDNDGQLADELRRRGYAVKATKLVEL